MKLALVNHGVFPDVIGGMERHTFHLARTLKEEGVDVHVLVPQPVTKTEYPFPVHHLSWPRRPTWLLSNYAFTKEVSRWIEMEQPDLAFGQGFNLWAYVKRRKIPCVFHPHGLEMFGSHLSFKEQLMTIPFRHLVRYHGRNSEAVISLGKRLTKILVERGGVDSEKIVEIPNAIEPWKQSVPLRRSPRSILFVGRLAFNKGIDLIERALALLPDQSFTLTILGDGPLRDRVEALSKRDNRVSYRSKVDDRVLAEAYVSHEAFLFSSRFEGMPTVVLEAMSSGCFVIATDVGAVNEMVSIDTGLLMEPNAEAIARGMGEYLKLSQTELSRRARAGRDLVLQRFTWNHVKKDYLNLIERLSDSGSRRRGSV